MSRVLFHVQHLLGIGHLRRVAHLVDALAGHGFEVTVASGGMPVDGFELAADVVQLPALRARDATSFALVDDSGRRVGRRWWRRRRRALLELSKRLEPAALIVEMFPFGRLKLARELVPLLIAAGRRGCLRISSMRDIAVPKRRAWRNRLMVRLAEHLFDRLLIHGDPRLGTLDESLPPAARLQKRLEYTGYVAAPPAAASVPAERRDGGVVVSAGGGSVGGRLLRSALAARPMSRFADRPMRLICGPNLPPQEAEELRRTAPEGVAVDGHRRDLPEILARAEVSISQAGYNTAVELLAARVPAVLVPFAAAGETEQTLRASWLAERELVEVVGEAELDPPTLAAALDRAAAPGDHGIDLGGAVRTAELLAGALAKRRNRRRKPS